MYAFDRDNQLMYGVGLTSCSLFLRILAAAVCYGGFFHARVHSHSLSFEGVDHPLDLWFYILHNSHTLYDLCFHRRIQIRQQRVYFIVFGLKDE